MARLSAERWVLVGPEFDRALELDPDGRVAWLESLRARDPALADDVESALADHRALDEQQFLEQPPAVPDEPAFAGRTFGAWTLVAPLGRGGMGSVWLARRSDGRYEGEAAVKLLNASLVGRAGEERFRREASILARLRHSGIAHLLDAGVSALGEPYIVLERVDGEPIDRYCDAGALSVEARVRLFLEVLDAVAHAHANLVVHRDIKPSNVLVDRNGRVRLLDFGIAKLLEADASSAPATELTEQGGRALTPEYASPEQVTGAPITTASDVYALGVLIYTLLAGVHPLAADRRSPADLIREIVDTEPRRLSDAAPDEDLRRRLRGDLETIVAKALKKRPEERFASVTAFAEDLRRWLRHEPIGARPDNPLYRLGKFVRRNRTAVTAAGLAVFGLVAATVVSWDRMREARRQRDAALYQKRRADGEIEFQHLLVSTIGAEPVTMRQIVDQGAILLDKEYGDDPGVAASIALALASQYEMLGDLEHQGETLRRAETLAERAGARDLVLRSRCSQAVNLRQRNHPDEGSALLARLQPELEHAPPEVLAECLNRQAESEMRANRFESAAALATRSVALAEQAGLTKGMPYLEVLNTRANAIENIGKGRDALAIYRRIDRLLEESGRGKTMFRTVIHNNIGTALSNLGEMTAAAPMLRRAMDEFRQSDPGDNVHPAILINYCRTMMFLRRLDEAALWYERLYRQSAAQNDPNMQDDGAYGMAEVEILRGRLDEAETWIAEEGRVQKRLAEPRVANAPYLEGTLAKARGDLGRARSALRRALTAQGYDRGERTYQMQAALIHAAEAALEAHAAQEALEYARAAHGIAAADPLTETRSAYVGEADLLEGRALLASGDTAGARTALARARAALIAGAGEDHPRAREADALLARLPS